MAGCIVFFVNLRIRFVETAGNNSASLWARVVTIIISSLAYPPFYFPDYVNDILEIDNQEETPI